MSLIKRNTIINIVEQVSTKPYIVNIGLRAGTGNQSIDYDSVLHHLASSGLDVTDHEFHPARDKDDEDTLVAKFNTDKPENELHDTIRAVASNSGQMAVPLKCCTTNTGKMIAPNQDEVNSMPWGEYSEDYFKNLQGSDHTQPYNPYHLDVPVPSHLIIPIATKTS